MDEAPPSIDQDIGLAYFEVPLAELMDDLSFNLSFVLPTMSSTSMWTPTRLANITGNLALYKQYTSSYGNTEITDEIIPDGGENRPGTSPTRIWPPGSSMTTLLRM
jgi:hypothetical protein